MTDPKRPTSGDAPSWVDEVLSRGTSAPPAPQPQARASHVPPPRPVADDPARDLRLPEDPPRPVPPLSEPGPQLRDTQPGRWEDTDWVARATAGSARSPQMPSSSPVPPPPPQTDAWGDPLRPSPAPASRPPVSSYAAPPALTGDIAQKKLIAGLLGILLGSLGIHKFYLGMNTAGLLMLGLNLGVWALAWVLTLLTFGVAGILLLPLAGLVSGAVGLVGLIEGILYLTKSDADFQRDYLSGKKPWF